MSYGFRGWDAAGNLDLDISTRCGRIIGVVDPGLGDGWINVPQFAEGTPFSTFLNPYATSEFMSGVQAYGFPIVSIGGTILSWTYAREAGLTPVAGQGGLIAFGVF